MQISPATLAGQGVPGAAASSALTVAGAAATSGEDVAAVPLRWLDADRVLYVGDGKIRIRQLGAGTVREVPFTVRLRASRPSYSKKNVNFDSVKTRPVQGIASPRLSPDGSQVAFIALNKLWLMLIGTKPRQVIQSEPQFVLQSLSWSPDGQSVLFSWDHDGLPAIWRYDIPSGQHSRMTGFAFYQGAMSPDGQNLAVTNEANALLRVDVASGQTTQLVTPLRGPERVGAPAWSPDSRWIAFNDRQQINGRFREGYNVIRVVDATTGASTSTPRRRSARSPTVGTAVRHGRRTGNGWHSSWSQRCGCCRSVLPVRRRDPRRCSRCHGNQQTRRHGAAIRGPCCT